MATLLSLTVRREAATTFIAAHVASALAEASAAFPDYALEAQEADGGYVVATAPSMKVARWLRG